MSEQPSKYSAAWAQQELAGRDWMPIRRCSICNQAIGYMSEGERLYFSSGCDCVQYVSAPDPRSWQDIADTLALQSSDEIRDRIVETLKGEREPA